MNTTTIDNLGATGRVTGNESVAWAMPPAQWSPADLRYAVVLNLGALARTPGAIAMVDALTSTAADFERAQGQRGNARRAAGLALLRRAVGSVVGASLRAWRNEAAVFQSMQTVAFSGELVGARQFVAATEALVGCGLLLHKPGVRFLGTQWDAATAATFEGKASRFRPSAGLLSLATAHGVTPKTVREDFQPDYTTTPPSVPEATTLVLKPLTRRGQPPAIASFKRDAPASVALRARVAAANELAGSHEVRGCTPPRWRRVFIGSLGLFGRWTAQGAGNYQLIPAADRRAITIDGEAVAEVDVRASHLTLMHGLLGLPLPPGDPYDLGGDTGVPREAVKAWITATLGKGSPVRRWQAGKVAEMPILAEHSADVVGQLVVARYPFLQNPADAVDIPAGLTSGFAHLAPPKRTLTLRLMSLEAEALTRALDELQEWRVLGLPLHDALIVRLSDVGHGQRALVDAFQAAHGVTPTLSVTGL